ncbi:MAG TPA: hypothetical protein VN820_05065 [Acidimicrobiales bacterium]|nr:hypothetical protein [Acidimicrobiales bacterium]
MEANDTSNVPGHGGVIDRATLYLCRQGEKWVVVIESARISSALGLRDAGQDAYDARFELLSRARRACPDAAIFSTDGALESADYGWRCEVSRPRPATSGSRCTVSSRPTPRPTGDVGRND